MIGAVFTQSLTKKDLIELIEKNFPEDRGNIAVLTSVSERGHDKITGQALTFEKVLEDKPTSCEHEWEAVCAGTDGAYYRCKKCKEVKVV